MFVVCDTLSGCIFLIKLFDNYVRGSECYKVPLRALITLAFIVEL